MSFIQAFRSYATYPLSSSIARERAIMKDTRDTKNVTGTFDPKPEKKLSRVLQTKLLLVFERY